MLKGCSQPMAARSRSAVGDNICTPPKAAAQSRGVESVGTSDAPWRYSLPHPRRRPSASKRKRRVPLRCPSTSMVASAPQALCSANLSPLLESRYICRRCARPQALRQVCAAHHAQSWQGHHRYRSSSALSSLKVTFEAKAQHPIHPPSAPEMVCMLIISLSAPLRVACVPHLLRQARRAPRPKALG